MISHPYLFLSDFEGTIFSKGRKIGPCRTTRIDAIFAVIQIIFQETKTIIPVTTVYLFYFGFVHHRDEYREKILKVGDLN